MAAPLNPVERALQRVAAELGEADALCALVGGLAVSARAEPRTTRDVDLAVSVRDDDQAEQLIWWGSASTSDVPAGSRLRGEHHAAQVFNRRS